jgi:hypothetical protein
MLTEERRGMVRTRARAAIQQATLRTDAWWAQPLVSMIVLGIFVIYATWAAIIGTHYYSDPYISPLYAPCIADSCAHVSFHIIGSFWRWSPALLIILFPLGFRTTCYFYRRVYYRGGFWAPAACAVKEPRVALLRPVPSTKYRGESRGVLMVMNAHRYFFYVAFVLAILHWTDFVLSFHFQAGWGIGFGTLLMGLDTVLLSLYVLSCHAGRHFLGGHVNTFSRSPIRYRLWKLSTRFNPNHGPIAWASLVSVMLVDIYVRLLSYGVFHDPHLIFFAK